MNDILRYFRENYKGSEDAVLESLAEGSLIGSIKFPSYDPSWKTVPADFWNSIDASELISLSKKQSGHKQIEEVCIEGEALYGAELKRLNTIAMAAADHNAELIDKRLRSLVIAELRVKKISDISDWLGLIRVFHKLSIQLYEECSEHFDVFVSDKNWTLFTNRQEPVETPPDEGGRPEDKWWPELLWALVNRVVDTQGQSIHEIAGFKHRSELSRHIHDIVMKEKKLQSTSLVSAKRISQVLGDKIPKK